MRIANLAGRLVLVTGSGAVDVELASNGCFSADPQAVYRRWDEFVGWAAQAAHGSGVSYDEEALGPPAPAPSQIFAVGLNYRDHASEAGLGLPDSPTVFTKFVTSLSGPFGVVELSSGSVDWEIELVVVIGRECRHVPVEEAWWHVAGVTVGQDISDRTIQMAGPAPQFSLGKSFPGFGPTGPWLVTPDELPGRDDLRLTCSINGEPVQTGQTGDLVFPVSELISRLSAVLPLLPGDVIFTGTPAGVGVARTPQRFLQAGDEVVSRIEGIGEMRHRVVAADARVARAATSTGGHER